MKTVDFTQHLLNVQSELFRFAFKLTADREEANDLLQETSLPQFGITECFIQYKCSVKTPPPHTIRSG